MHKMKRRCCSLKKTWSREKKVRLFVIENGGGKGREEKRGTWRVGKKVRSGTLGRLWVGKQPGRQDFRGLEEQMELSKYPQCTRAHLSRLRGLLRGGALGASRCASGCYRGRDVTLGDKPNTKTVTVPPLTALTQACFRVVPFHGFPRQVRPAVAVVVMGACGLLCFALPATK